jgi:large subunit ribosomal protein L15
MANELSNLAPNPGSRKSRMRLGRGEGSGKGRNAGRGTKGDKSRSGHKVRAYFEGGQMPLHRRLPKRGFFNHFGKDFEVVNLEKLGDVEAGTQVTADFLADAGIISRVGKDGVKLLGRGEITVALHVKLAKVSDSARAKIVAAGGTVETPSDDAAAE